MQKILLAMILLFSVTTDSLAEEALTVNVSRLSADVANKIAMNALKTCRKKGISVTATVVDRNGIIQSQIRDTVAPPVSLGISFKKAYTAVMFNARGSHLAGKAHSALQQLNENLAFTSGSVPIAAGGKLYGAVGVSGAPDGADDEACALAGFESVADDLEMQ